MFSLNRTLAGHQECYQPSAHDAHPPLDARVQGDRLNSRGGSCIHDFTNAANNIYYERAEHQFADERAPLAPRIPEFIILPGDLARSWAPYDPGGNNPRRSSSNTGHLPGRASVWPHALRAVTWTRPAAS